MAPMVHILGSPNLSFTVCKVGTWLVGRFLG